MRDTGAWEKVIALAGNPNVGKSTVFNALTGMRQHTGNWSGKTVTQTQGYCTYKKKRYKIVDLPGCYSLIAPSAEEEVARDFICGGGADVVIVVCDATCLERGLSLVLQTLEITSRVVVCVNLLDEAKKKKIHINLQKLSQKLEVPVIGTTARNQKGLGILMEAVTQTAAPPHRDTEIQDVSERRERFQDEIIPSIIRTAECLYQETVIHENQGAHLKTPSSDDFENQIPYQLSAADRILTGKWTAFPIMIMALMGVFWLTLTGANYPSQFLSHFLFWIEDQLIVFFQWLQTPQFVTEMLVLGIYRVLAWVVSVMLPPMAIFFPVFTILEDVGFLPRIAFNLDKWFKKCSACGKQALTMCMGFGCNAAGVIGCRIIDSPRERLIAIVTNSFVPCNGRFPTLIALISMFFVGTMTAGSITGGAEIGKSIFAAGLLTGVIVLGVGMTFVVSKFLSQTLLKGSPSSFTLELPPYRRPQIGKVIVRSMLDRTLFVLGRAICMAAPAGLIIWLMANIILEDKSVLLHCSDFLEPFARLLGMDGVILLAFILGFPANEIVIPIIIMAYMAKGNILDINNLNTLKELLTAHGWTWVTAISVMLFSLMHWPCSTTCLSIKKETQSLKWTLVSMGIPTVMGMVLCFVFASLARGFMG